MLAFNPIIISNYDSDTEETVRPLGVQAPNTEKEVIVEPAKESEPSKEETDGEDEEEPEEDLKEETVPEEPTPVQPSTLGKRTCFSEKC
ncbi:uncharacterized protein [Rutidosis leptorrhynchoides]|uniref:uncharacterized protein isoform X2 n=1 Tax=Rutidosis leptorrhynchoides TaxID=125765 RepID=UPI003A9A60A1